MNPGEHQIQPIDSLTPFLGGNWWIRARVTDKTDIRTWNKPESQGKLFSFTLIDESASIRATVFNEAVDVFNPLIANGQVYYFSGAQVKNANRRFSNVNNDYELTFDRTSDIRPCRMDNAASALPTKRYNFVPIEILKQRLNSLVDVIGVVLSVDPISSVVQRSTGKELQRRTVKLADTSAAVEVTLWNEEAQRWSFPQGTVIAMSNLRTGSYNGVSLSTTQQTQFDPNPEIPDAKKLQEWYRSTGAKNVESLSVFTPLSQNSGHGRKYFDEIAAENLGRGGKPAYVDVRCVPIYIKQEDQWYSACPECNKKVNPEGPTGDRFRCEKCDKTVVPTQRYLISLQATDNVSQEWLTLFNDTGVEFYGMTAEQLKQKTEEDPMILTKLVQARMNRPVLMRLRVQEDMGYKAQGGEGERIRLTVSRLTEFMSIPNVADEQRLVLARHLKEECEDMLTCIEAYC
eukprot:gene8248-5769_t